MAEGNLDDHRINFLERLWALENRVGVMEAMQQVNASLMEDIREGQKTLIEMAQTGETDRKEIARRLGEIEPTAKLVARWFLFGNMSVRAIVVLVSIVAGVAGAIAGVAAAWTGLARWFGR
jgi:hypothetical protein